MSVGLRLVGAVQEIQILPFEIWSMETREDFADYRSLSLHHYTRIRRGWIISHDKRINFTLQKYVPASV